MCVPCPSGRGNGLLGSRCTEEQYHLLGLSPPSWQQVEIILYYSNVSEWGCIARVRMGWENLG